MIPLAIQQIIVPIPLLREESPFNNVDNILVGRISMIISPWVVISWIFQYNAIFQCKT